MRGYAICKHCKGVGKTFKWLIFPKRCPYCNGMGYILTFLLMLAIK